MDIIKKENSDIVVSRRKKRNKENKKSIFEIYKSEKTIKDYMFKKKMLKIILFIYLKTENYKNHLSIKFYLL